MRSVRTQNQSLIFVWGRAKLATDRHDAGPQQGHRREDLFVSPEHTHLQSEIYTEREPSPRTRRSRSSQLPSSYLAIAAFNCDSTMSSSSNCRTRYSLKSCSSKFVPYTRNNMTSSGDSPACQDVMTTFASRSGSVGNCAKNCSSAISCQRSHSVPAAAI